MKRKRSSEHGGSTFLEFVLVGVPVIFVMFSTFEMARGMWSYHSLAYAVREGTRYAIVHGASCSTDPNSCTVTIGQIAGSAITCTMNNCLSNNTTWPPSSANSIGTPLTISANYPFRSGIAFFFPGSRPTGSFPAMNFPASSKDLIQF
jgi:Flp pilus assembly protein TadG